ncbi:MAG: sigma-70 family RNA polymerase sigma factor [Acidobacteria bacterium]|nr:sigma-70 family RNA polymerase sigma factor [Acidobacteriota bacterium]MCB9377947.1 sigma-70 family RNA polymerase sigma factor [Holophagales bacterium]
MEREGRAEREPAEITELLAGHAAGDSEALGEVFRRVYDELLRLARSQRRRLGAGETMDTVALVHDCYLKLVGGAGVPAKDRGHFFAIAARAMRHLLVDHARSRRRAKRRADLETLDDDVRGLTVEIETILAVHEGLGRLAAIDPRLVQVAECRFFAGLSVPETAEALGLSVSTVERTWRAVRTYLGEQLAG